ncbi:hypothetical protein [Sphingomonas elodea]|uniref:hypothetical protein n=1 Tax=Sphingomonas elodea TaxID=179878 RepID=UPI0002631DC5|nr:hypothetical protein [Sphingomonas elodea]
MADAAPITGAPSRASGFSEELSATRRTVIGAMIAGAALAVPARAHAHSAQPLTEWDRVRLRMEAARARSETFKAEVFDPIEEQLNRQAPRPPMYFEVQATSGEVARYHLYPWALDAYQHHVASPIREGAAALAERWRAWQSAKEGTGFHVVQKQFGELEDAWAELEDQLMSMPAPHHAALLWKIGHLLGPSARQESGCTTSWCSEFADAVMADAERLLAN